VDHVRAVDRSPRGVLAASTAPRSLTFTGGCRPHGARVPAQGRVGHGQHVRPQRQVV